ncbi:unannotated protein [freshwater metagenome]|uniref:Unannotated protein n=1 Tax=freshwater metagenome TaxID=449393 RepID=A0A6J6WDM6_9ZZZZ
MTKRANSSTKTSASARGTNSVKNGVMYCDATFKMRGRPSTVSDLSAVPSSVDSIMVRFSSARISRIAYTETLTAKSSNDSTGSMLERMPAKNSPSSRTRKASNMTSLPPGKIRYRVARETLASVATSSIVNLLIPQRSTQRRAASRMRSSGLCIVVSLVTTR